MKKYISTEAAADAILDYEEYNQDYNEGLRRAILCISTEVPAANVIPLEWVSVNDRLPEPYFPIWAACKAEGRENWVIETGYIPESRSPWGNYQLLVNGKATVYAWAERHTPEAPKEG